MLKFLRRYSKWILVIGGVLLLISFLAPQAIQQAGQVPLFQPVVATLDGRKIRGADVEQAALEVRALAQFHEPLVLFYVPLDPEQRAEHWMLLSHAAREGGFVGGAADGREWIPLLAQDVVRANVEAQLRQQFGSFLGANIDAFVAQQAAAQMETDEAVAMVNQFAQRLVDIRAQVAGQHRMTEAEFDELLGTARGVNRMLRAYGSIHRASGADAVRRALDVLDRVNVDLLGIPAQTFAETAPEPTAEQLQAHFESSREKARGEGEHGFGYRLPNRVKVEWLTLDRAAVEQAITIPVLEVARAHQEDRTRFPGELDAERARIEAELRGRKADRVLDAAEAVIRAEFSSAMRNLPRAGEYYALPDTWATDRPTLESLADRVVEALATKENVRISAPQVSRTEGWVEAPAGLTQLDGLSGASVTRGSQRIALASLLTQARELAGDNLLGVQVGAPILGSLSVRDARGNRFIVVLTDAAKAGAPEAIADMIDPERVRDDWRRLQAFQSLASRVEEFRAVAADGGLERVVELLQGPEPSTTDAPTDPDAQPTEPTTLGPDAPAHSEPPVGDAPTTGTDAEAPGAAGQQPSDAGAPVADAPTEGSEAANPETASAEADANPDKADPETADEPERLRPTNVVLSRQDIAPLRDAAFAIADALDPLQPIDQAPVSARVFAVPLPDQLAVAVGIVSGLQPTTIEQLRLSGERALFESLSKDLLDNASDVMPFSVEALSSRFGFELTRRARDAAERAGDSAGASSDSAITGGTGDAPGA